MAWATEAKVRIYYDAELLERAKVSRPDMSKHLPAFVRLLTQEHRNGILEIGAGAGQDGDVFQNLGTDYQASWRLNTLIPFVSDALEAAWSLSMMLHILDLQLDRALDEPRRGVKPGTLVALGTRVVNRACDRRAILRQFRFGPRRSCLRCDAQWSQALTCVGVVSYRTFPAKECRCKYALLRIRTTHGAASDGLSLGPYAAITETRPTGTGQ